MIGLTALPSFTPPVTASTYRFLKLVVTSVHLGNFAGFLNVRYSDDGGVNYVPFSNMTSNIAPSPLVSSASTEINAANAAWKAFDNLASTRWTSASGSQDGSWITIDLGVGSEILPNRVRLQTFNLAGADGSPTEFKVFGSNTGSFAGEETLISAKSGLPSLPNNTVTDHIL